MALSNYSDLIENLKDYTLRSDAPFAVFIRLAEQEFAPFIKHYLSEKTVNLTITDSKIKLPSDFSEARTVKVDGKVAKPISNNGGTLYPTEVGYRQNADELHFAANFAIQTVTLTYWSRIPSLTPSNPTNWLIERFPAVYLHGALARFYRWAKDDQAEALEKQDLAGAIAAIDTDNKRGTKIANPISFGGEEW